MVMQSMFENLYPEVACCIALGDDVCWEDASSFGATEYGIKSL